MEHKKTLDEDESSGNILETDMENVDIVSGHICNF